MNQGTICVTDWCDLFSSVGSTYEGFVNTKQEFEDLKWNFEVQTKSYFPSVKTYLNFGNTDITTKHHKIQWPDSSQQFIPDHPYIIVHTERYECHHGPDRNKAKKEKARNAQKGDHDTYQKKRFLTQMTKKLNCPAAIIAKEFVFFTEFKASVSKYKREITSKEIKKKLDEKAPPKFHRQILVKLPSIHENHHPGEVDEISLPVDKRITAKIEEYVSEGFVSSSCIRSLLEQFVRRDLFAGQKCPSWIDRRFFPSQRDISNAIYAAKLKAMKSKYDQENLQEHIDEWAKEQPNDNFMFSASTEEDIDSNSDSGFFLYQSSWQKRLLNLYGNELCLLDATYRTTKYSIPLFFLCVKTNVDYSVVATFACQSENSFTISKALVMIKEWNPDWNPRHFMVDNCEAELNAIASCFPDCQSFICDFHREQAWGRWLKASKHGLNKNVDDILPLLRRVARSSTKADFDLAVSNLKENHWWKQNKEFRDWFTNTWLKNIEKWAWIHRKDRLLVNINTNNGVERQNRTLKYDFLSKYTDRSLTGMLTTVIKRFLPEQYRKYLDFNIKASAYYKKYNENLPAFLHNRPKEFIDHCRKRLSTPEEVQGKIVSGEGVFTVRSFTDSSTTYVVTLGTETEVPSCECHDWTHSHWPCKHMLAVVMHYPGYTWDHLAAHYRNNVMFVLDNLCIHDIGFKVQDNHESPDESKSKDNSSSDQTSSTEETLVQNDSSDIKTKDICKAIREELEHIKALTYLEVPVNLQHKVLQDLIMLTATLEQSVPSDNNLPLLDSKPTVKSTYEAPFNITKRKSKLEIQKNCKRKEEIVLKKSKSSLAESDNNIASNLVEILWQLETDYDVPVAKIDGSVITDTDIRSLSENQWLTDKVLDSYLAILSTAQNDLGRNIIHFCQTMMTGIINRQFNVNDVRKQKHQVLDSYLAILSTAQNDLGRNIIHFCQTMMTGIINRQFNVNDVRKQKHQLENSELVMGIYHRSAHWTLIVADMKQGILFFYNPAVEQGLEMRKILNSWKTYIDQYVKRFGENVVLDWKIQAVSHSIQKDSYNCGIYCLIFAEKHLQNDFESMKRLAFDDLKEMRKKVAQQLMLYEVFLTGCCPKCGFELGEEQGIECCKCRRSYHFKPFCVERDLEDSSSNFTCRLCLINFWGNEHGIQENCVSKGPIDGHITIELEETGNSPSREDVSYHDFDELPVPQQCLSHKDFHEQEHFSTNSYKEGSEEVRYFLRKSPKKKRKRDSFFYPDIMPKKVHIEGEMADHHDHTDEEVSSDVLGYTYNEQKFSGLGDSIPAEVVDLYLSLKCKQCKERNVHCLANEIVTSIFCSVGDPVHKYLELIDIESYDILIGALHEGGCHWTLVAIFPKERKVLYVDPLGESEQTKSLYRQQWLNFLTERYNQKIGTHLGENWSVVSFDHQKQSDSNSSGVFILKFADVILSRNKHLDIFFKKVFKDNKDITDFRMKIGQYLIQCSVDKIQDTSKSPEESDRKMYDMLGRVCIIPDDEANEDDKDDALSECLIRKEINPDMFPNSLPDDIYKDMKDYLYDIMECESTQCKLESHKRHHNFIQSPVQVCKVERACFGFGCEVISEETIKYLEVKMNIDLVHYPLDPSKPLRVKKGTLRNLKNNKLSKIFSLHWLVELYITGVLLKEAIIYLHIKNSKKKYSICEGECTVSEVNKAEELKKLKRK